jgi:hypothetical protein
VQGIVLDEAAAIGGIGVPMGQKSWQNANETTRDENKKPKTWRRTNNKPAPFHKKNQKLKTRIQKQVFQSSLII